jgi:DivIVA domain-containing protein
VATLFLAYAPADRQRASALADGLRAAAHTVHTAPAPGDGDDAWWSAVLADIRTADVFLYATSPRSTPADPTSEASAGSRWAPPDADVNRGDRFSPEATPGVVSRELEQARALGIPTLEIHLSGGGPPTGFDFRERDADAAFALIGAIAAAARGAGPSAGPSAGSSPGSSAGETSRPDGVVAAERVSSLKEASGASSKWAPRVSLTADDVHRIGFRKPPLGRRGYDEESVDKFLDQVESDLLARQSGGPLIRVALTAADVHAVAFLRPPFGRRGYDEEQVDHFLDEVHRTFTALDRDLESRGATVAKA